MYVIINHTKMKELFINSATGNVYSFIKNEKTFFPAHPLFTLFSSNKKYNQIYEPENVNIRRREIGLGSIEDSAFKFNISWDLKKHKNRYLIK